MRPSRLAALMVGLAILSAQAGHLVAYSLRFGGAAQQIQSGGAHAYFPTLLKTAFGAGSLVVVGSLFVIGLARVLTGRVPRRAGAPPFVRLLALLFTLQLAWFAGQETVEAMVAGVPAGSAELLLLWGTVGQLPVAVVSTVALSWLVTRLGPALAAIDVRLPSPSRPIARPVAPRSRALAAAFTVPNRPRASVVSRRGPPSF